MECRLCYIRFMLTNFKHRLDEYAQNKTWYWYLPFWIFGAYLFIKLLGFRLSEPAPSFFISIAQSFDFVLHEMAHLFTAFLPAILTAAAGSVSELLLGLVLILTAFWVRSYFASLFCFLWFMLATQATADYMADARAQNLPLVSFGGGDPIHDWNFVFTKLGILQQDTVIAGMVRGTGILAAVASLLFSGWLIIRIAQAKSAAQSKAQPTTNIGTDKPFAASDLYPKAQAGRLADRPTPEDKLPPQDN